MNTQITIEKCSSKELQASNRHSANIVSNTQSKLLFQITDLPSIWTVGGEIEWLVRRSNPEIICYYFVRRERLWQEHLQFGPGSSCGTWARLCWMQNRTI